ncbi:uncharacterized protein LOC122504960 [Leptopilina heterotoma]|uniref:uncharacterized protein LOC122504960 n=1 Tax=Leptopilina heterotoma TaxID=63436 RepID=UPI001CA9F237|nr:uncharacterized protein LOC122504960 [Leptopilina heterotoma]XP_043472269.1 uncharacterized protein LOC122504960 [Leptopilina heterotoma]
MSRLRENTKFIKLYLFGINIFFLAEAAPSLSHQKSLSDDFNPIISLLCSTNEPCWNSLADSSYIFEQAGMQEPRTQMIRGINSPSWNGTPEKLDFAQRNARIAQSVLPTTFSNRIAKKDVFMSRGWGAGGLPFSVLYMNAHNSRNNHPTNINSVDSSSLALKSPTQMQSNAENLPAVGKNILQNYRVALRNKPSNQTRRQYSIIPQLFISYGWGPHEN